MDTLELIDYYLDEINLNCYHKLIDYISNDDYDNFREYLKFIQYIHIDVHIKKFLTEYLYNYDTLKNLDNKYYIALFKYIDYEYLKEKIIKILTNSFKDN